MEAATSTAEAAANVMWALLISIFCCCCCCQLPSSSSFHFLFSCRQSQLNSLISHRAAAAVAASRVAPAPSQFSNVKPLKVITSTVSVAPPPPFFPLSCLASWQHKWAEIFGQKPLEDYTHSRALVLWLQLLFPLEQIPYGSASLFVCLSLSLSLCLPLSVSPSFSVVSLSLWLHRNKVVGLCWRFLALPIAVINHNVQPWRTLNSYTARKEGWEMCNYFRIS